jgi:ABC-type branched-subunit amino acid transport system substrate-binding protein
LGQRGYARVIASDDYEVAAGAVLAKRLGRGAVYYLEDRDWSAGDPRRSWFQRAARRVGLRVAGEEAFRAKAKSYRGLADRVRASGVRSVYLNSFVAANLGPMLRDLRAVLDSRVAIIGNQSFLPVSALFANAGNAARGVHITSPGLPIDRLGATGRRFVRAFGATQPRRSRTSTSTPRQRPRCCSTPSHAQTAPAAPWHARSPPADSPTAHSGRWRSTAAVSSSRIPSASCAPNAAAASRSTSRWTGA